MSEAEVAKHNTQNDLYVIINGVVLDLTSYQKWHPAGKASIERCAGKDCTTGFDAAASHKGVQILGYKVADVGAACQPAAAPAAAMVVTHTTADIAKHSTPSDCWVIVNARVYDMTHYHSAHPGGSSEITRYCGGDGSSDFFIDDHTDSGIDETSLKPFFVANVEGQTPQNLSGATSTSPLLSAFFLGLALTVAVFL
eukprot:GFYU01005925.1.p1 GENE.GFYU01005925.1~~GFYU01005925.1.p1  ORF type:complete len:226 (+),score=80.77 GFYU01005925.1:90-680(+)